MTRRVYITGASGAGTTTLAKALSSEMGVNFADVDDAYWLPTDPPFSQKRRVADRITWLRKALGRGDWVMSGSFDSWGDPLLERVNLVVFVSVPTTTRLARLSLREYKRFGDRIRPGGDMASTHAGFMAWASCYDDPNFCGRNLQRHLDWLASLPNQVLRVDGRVPTSQLVDQVLAHPAMTRRKTLRVPDQRISTSASYA